MKAVRLDLNHQPYFDELPLPAPAANEVQIRVKCAGICATDLGYIDNGSPRLHLPLTPGHEVSGVVAAVGGDVAGFRVGERVIVTNDWYVCRKCRACLAGAENMCRLRESLGSAHDGAFAEYLTVPEHMVRRLPDRFGFRAGAMLEVYACAVHGLVDIAGAAKNAGNSENNAGNAGNAGKNTANAGRTLLVQGPGALGLSYLLCGIQLGFHTAVVGTERDTVRLELARQLGADFVSDGRERGGLADFLGDGADITVVAAGAYAALSDALDCTAACGTVIQAGILHGNMPIDLSAITKKELRLVGAYAKLNASWDYAIETADGAALERLISDTYTFEDYKAAFARARNLGSVRVAFEP